LLRLYYEDESVRLFHGDCRDLLLEMDDDSVDLVITDPPYDQHTHSGALTLSAGAIDLAIPFAPFTQEEQVEVFTDLGRVCDRWVIATLAVRTSAMFLLDPPPGLRFVRLGCWAKTTTMPQLSGDRPAQGWEPIAFFHRDGVRSRWHGGGRTSVWRAAPVQREGHPTVKPLGMVSEWVRLFSEPGDLVLDPFAGSGTTLRAAKDEGRRAIGVEIDEAYCRLAARRLAQDTLFAGEEGA
jgi:site-specific DNA-methyltransferase (adenine-specific)